MALQIFGGGSATGGGGGGSAATLSTVAASGASRTVTIPAGGAIVTDLTLTANCTLTLAGATNNVFCQATLILRQDSTGSRTVTWPSAVLWATGTAPILSTSPTYTDVVTVWTINGGTSWFGALNGSSYQPQAAPSTAPASFSVTPGNGTTSLSWSAVLGASPAVSGYKVYRSTTTGTETLLTTLGNVTSYTDSALTNGTTYFYKVAALNTIGTGPQSSEASATPSAGGSLPATATAPTQWFKADAITGLSDGAAVASWVDSSATAQPIAQATAGKRPIYKTGVANTLPVVRFDGTDDYLTGTLTLPNDQNTFFAVIRPAVAGVGQMLFSTNVNGMAMQVTSANKVSVQKQAAAALVDSAATISTSAFSVVMGSWSSTTPFDEVGLNGAVNAGANRSATFAAGVATIGSMNQSGTFSTPFNGDVAEVIFYPANLSTTDRNAVKNYLAAKYGVTVS